MYIDLVYALFVFKYSYVFTCLRSIHDGVLCRVLAMMTTGLGGAPGITLTGMTGAAVGVLVVAATDRPPPHDEGQCTLSLTPS